MYMLLYVVGIASAIQRLRSAGTTQFVDSYIGMEHVRRDCAFVPMFNDSVQRIMGRTTIVRTRNVSRSLAAYRRNPCVRNVSFFPLFSRNVRGTSCSDPYVGYQAYLTQTRVRDAWAFAGLHETYIIVVDDGIAPHFELRVHRRFEEDDVVIGMHGTSVAGVAAAEANGVGICGTLPVARLVDIPLLSDHFISDVAEAMAFDGEHAAWNGVYCNSWGPTDDGRCEGPGPLLDDAIHSGLLTGRGGRGCIYVFAAGNGGANENMNDDGYANHIGTIAVTALHDTGIAYFSEWGAAISVSAPGYQLLATSSTNNFMYFYGTSASAPIVAGVVALMLSINDALNWRSVQEILMASATAIGSASAYEFNAASHRYSYQTGPGLVDAVVASKLATAWVDIEQTLNASRTIEPRQVVPVFAGLRMDAAFLVEHVRVCVSIVGQNSAVSDGSSIGAWIESPQKTRSILTRPTSRVSVIAGCSYHDWCFSSLKHWGEEATGMWTVFVEDAASHASVVERIRVEAYGHVAPFAFHGCDASDAR